MKKLLLILALINITSIQSQTASNTSITDGKHEFIYNDAECFVDFNLLNNTFIEYNKSGKQLTHGSYSLTKETYHLIPTKISTKSIIDIAASFKNHLGS